MEVIETTAGLFHKTYPGLKVPKLPPLAADGHWLTCIHSIKEAKILKTDQPLLRTRKRPQIHQQLRRVPSSIEEAFLWLLCNAQDTLLKARGNFYLRPPGPEIKICFAEASLFMSANMKAMNLNILSGQKIWPT